LVDRELQPIAIEPGRAPYSRARRGGWTADAWMDASVLRLTHDDGRAVSIACAGPRTVAWIGQSLFVATLAAEVLRFPDLITRVENLLGSVAMMSGSPSASDSA
jgi:hypothetical protein